MMKKLIVFLVLAFWAGQASAYTIFSLKPVNWSKVKSVDVFIAGYGEELGLQFLYSAITRAQKHDELYPDSRAQLILWAKEDGKKSDEGEIRRRGFSVIKTSRWKLSDKVIFNQLKRLPSIHSIHFFSHNAAFAGAAVQKSERIGAKNFPWDELAGKFAPGAYIFLHGCNTGFVVAPGISRITGLPVMGSLTSTDFQQLFVNDQWYHNNKGFGQYPSGLAKKKTSGPLFNESKSCWKGYCHRMMPNEHTYRGHWGYYDIGLPYYQAFCTFSNNDGEKCGRGVADAILGTTPTINKSWEDQVMDYMCPRMADPKVYETCQKVLRGESNGKFFRGKIVKCSRSNCSAEIVNGRPEKQFRGKDAGNAQMVKDFEYFMSLEKYID
ncbi:MAG: hypothetical protein VXV96_18575 [Bdellovibrionota bacterium]|nr:hypothetical protein [Bdellovibrionota bacterium]